MPSKVGEVAIHMAATLGWRCLPVEPGGKIPRLGQWQIEATTDSTQLSRWFHTRSHANLGVATGPKSGIWILDVDPRHGGAESLAKLIAEHGPLPLTLVQDTPSGGLHYVFRWPADGGVRTRAHIDDGLDVRGEGGQFVVQPSTITDKETGEIREWKWRNWGQPIADAPEWLLAAVRAHHAQQPAEPGPQPKIPLGWGDRDREEAVARGALDGVCDEIRSAPNSAQEQTLNGGAYRIGRWVARGHLPEFYARERLIHAGLSMTSYDASDPWTPSVVSAKVERAMRDGAAAGPADLKPSGRPPLKTIEGGSKRPKGAREPEGSAAPDLRVAASSSDWMHEHHFSYGPKGLLNPKDPENIRLMIEHWPQMQGRYNHNRWDDALTINRPWPEDPRTDYPRPVVDSDFLALQARLWREGLTPTKEMVADALIEVAHRAWAINPLTSYLDALEWDGIDRLDTWLSSYMGVPDSPEARLFGRKFLIGAVARAKRPRCKNDTMLNVRGRQGQRKSTALRALFGELYFSDNLGNVRDKDALMGLAGMWGIEWAEMSGQSKGSDADLKAFLSRQEDRYRPPYGRAVVMRPRQCVIIGTTNKKAYLHDASGGRRYWPVECVQLIDIDAITKHRDQLWAEAMLRFDAGETWWLEGSKETEIAETAQEAVFEVDPWESIIVQKIAEHLPNGWVPTAEILSLWIGVTNERVSTEHARRVREIMERLGVPDKRDRLPTGQQLNGYVFGEEMDK